MGVLDTSYTFQNTDTITSAKMNNIIDQSTFTSGAIFGDTLELVSGQLKVRALGITSAELGANSVTTAAIANGNVISSKLATNIAISGTLSVASTFSVAGTSTFTGVPTATNGLIIGTTSFPAPTGSAPLYAARAFGKFIGGAGPTILSGSKNIASIARTSTGNYTVTFTTPVPSNSAIMLSSAAFTCLVVNNTTTSTNLRFYNGSIQLSDPSEIHLAVFG